MNQSSELGPVAWVSACAALIAVVAVFAPAAPIPDPSPVGANVADLADIADATSLGAPPQFEPKPAPIDPSAPLSAGAGAIFPEPKPDTRGWGALLGADPAAAFAFVREPKAFGRSTRAPACGALHPSPPYEERLSRVAIGPKTVAFAIRYLQLVPWPKGLTPEDRGELELLLHLAVDVLFQAKTDPARAALARLATLERSEPEDQGEFEHDCLSWQIERARLATAVLANTVPPTLEDVRPRLVRWLLQHIGPQGRIGAPWVHEPRWPCRTRAEEDGAPAEQVTAVACMALLNELEPDRARDLLAPTVRWLCKALPRVHSRAHTAEGCNDDLCRCERLGPEVEWVIRMVLQRARILKIEAVAITAALSARAGPPTPATAWPDPATSTLFTLARAACQRAVPSPPWRLAFSHRLLDTWRGATEDETEACRDAIGQEAPALEAASWLLAVQGLNRSLSGKSLPLARALPRVKRTVRLLTPGAAPVIRSSLIRELTAAGWYLVQKKRRSPDRTVTLQDGALLISGGKSTRSVPLSLRDAGELRAALERP